MGELPLLEGGTSASWSQATTAMVRPERVTSASGAGRAAPASSSPAPGISCAETRHGRGTNPRARGCRSRGMRTVTKVPSGGCLRPAGPAWERACERAGARCCPRWGIRNRLGSIPPTLLSRDAVSPGAEKPSGLPCDRCVGRSFNLCKPLDDARLRVMLGLGGIRRWKKREMVFRASVFHADRVRLCVQCGTDRAVPNAFLSARHAKTNVRHLAID